jgi:hypothetical protein
MWGSVGDRVYFSRDGQPEFWSPLDFVQLSNTCTGLGKFQDTVIAFTESYAYVISGFNRDNISLQKLPYNEGCLNHNCIASITGLLVWTSKNGICIYDGNAIEIVTKNLLSWTSNTWVGSSSFDDLDSSFDANIGYQVKYAIGVRGQYYAVFQSGICLVDFNNGIVVSTIELTDVSSLYFDSKENTINAISSDLSINSFNRDATYMTAQWKTPKLQDDNYSTIKQYRRVVLSDKPISVATYVNDKLVYTSYNRSDFYLPSGSIGNTIQFHITTDVEIKSLRYEYGVVNG